jgi:hypothetical protein
MGAATGRLKQPTIPVRVIRNGAATTRQRPVPFFSGGLIASEQQALCAGGLVVNCNGRTAAARALAHGKLAADITSGTLGCDLRDVPARKNVRVNQDCTFRRQAEESITYNPSDPNNLLAGQNDSRVGFNQCGIDFSLNNGSPWGDMLPPFRQHLNSPLDAAPNSIDPTQAGTLHTYDAASDPSNAADSQGRVFFGCVTFDVASFASGLFVTQSPTGAKGSFYFNVPQIGRTFIPVEDNSPFIFHDKPWVAADRYATSPNHDNVYVTWTVFKYGSTCTGPGGYCESPIYGSMSTDHGLTWSAPEQISGTSSSLCFLGDFFSSTPANDCNMDQGSSPVVLPDGTLVVAFNNSNTAQDNPDLQQLALRCRPSGNSAKGTAALNCGEPQFVGKDVVLGEPQCDFGRGPEECVPGPFIRTNDFPRIVTENTQNGHLYVVWQDYRNSEYDIQMAQSVDGGTTWKDAGQVNPDSNLDHYMPAVDQSPQTGDRVGGSYYRSGRVAHENTTPAGGFAPCPGSPVVYVGMAQKCQHDVGAQNSDYVLAGGTGKTTPYAFNVISPAFPPPDGIQSGFNGDYSAITINRALEAHPIWSDTRNANPYAQNGVIHDEDIFTDKLTLPSGTGTPSTGHIGHSGLQ